MNHPTTYQPPSILDIGYRCLALWAVILRFLLELQAQPGKTKAAMKQLKAQVRAHREWVEANDLYSHMTPKEQNIFRKPLCQWSNRDLTVVDNWSEMLGTLLWGAGILDEARPYDVVYPFEGLEEFIPVITTPLDFLEIIGSRARVEFSRASEVTWAYLFRVALVTARRNQSISLEDCQEVIHDLIEDMISDGFEPVLNQGDLDFCGKPIESISKKEAERVQERLKARLMCLGWLLGYRQDWDEPLFGYDGDQRPTWLADFQE